MIRKMIFCVVFYYEPRNFRLAIPTCRCATATLICSRRVHRKKMPLKSAFHGNFRRQADKHSQPEKSHINQLRGQRRLHRKYHDHEYRAEDEIVCCTLTGLACPYLFEVLAWTLVSTTGCYFHPGHNAQQGAAPKFGEVLCVCICWEKVSQNEAENILSSSS